MIEAADLFELVHTPRGVLEVPLAVRNMAEFNRALAEVDRDVRLGIRKEQRAVAEPVRLEAERLAVAGVTGIGSGWSRMRTAVTRNSVYVAPRKSGTKDPRLKRPAFGTLLLSRAMEPALAVHESSIEGRYEAMLDRVADDFNRAGLL